MQARRRVTPEPDTGRARGWVYLAVGAVVAALGPVLDVALGRSVDGPLSSGGGGTIGLVALIAGGLVAARGVWLVLRTGMVRGDFGVRGGYKSFVAWRYLLIPEPKVTTRTKQLLAAGFGLWVVLAAVGYFAPPSDLDAEIRLFQSLVLEATAAVILWGVVRHSKVAVITVFLGVMLILVGGLGLKLFGGARQPLDGFESGLRAGVLAGFGIARIGGAVLAGLATFFGALRAFFTFFTVVPIGGVWIGTAALVMVLAVMSGFESDLRDKILGSNAHVQVAREDGDFVEWRDVQTRIDRMPEVVASTPFAVSEVVIAANNTGQNVIIKGIDPATVGKVTDLVSDLEDREAMTRLEPLIDDSRDLRVPQQPPPAGGDVIDPPPADLPRPGEPIDYSGSHDDASGGPGSDSGGAGSAGPSTGDGADGAGVLLEESSPFGGDATKLIDIDASADHARSRWVPPPVPPVIDPPPPDLLTTDEPPADYSSPGYLPDSAVRVIDIPFDSPSLSRRTQSLPGILVGRELVKQTHLYTGEEVRVVSPLSDPANPDATGTPIPFHRDYRVAGTFYTGMYEYDLKYVYVTLESLQDFLDRGDTVDGIEIRVRNPNDTDAFVAKLQATFGPRYRVQDWKELNRSLFSALKLEKIAMFLVLGIVIMVASFAILGNLVMVVHGKARQISLLKTLGASDVGVLQLFATQGLMIGAIGTVLGVATGLAGCWFAAKYGIPVSPEVYYIDRLPIHVEPLSVIAAASAGILISIAATLYPALVAARIQPAAGLRQ